MTQTILHTASQAPHALLITLVDGTTTFRFCRWDDDVAVGGDTFTSMPSLTYDIEAQGGSAEDAKATITMDSTIAPVPALLSPYVHAVITATLQEVIPGTDASLRNIFKGTFGSVTQNPEGNENVVKIEVHGLKRRLEDAKVGFPALSTCLNILGDSRCQKDISGDILTGTVASVRSQFDNQVVVTLTGSPNMTNARWRRGYVSVNGARSVIRQIIDAGTNPAPTVSLFLREFPPDSWVGETITLTPGCDGNLSTCRTVWNNEVHYMGIGFAMPSRNPVFSE